jgi:hypothetical protein
MKLAFAAVVLLACSMLAGCGSSSLSNSSLAPPEWSKTAFAGASSELKDGTSSTETRSDGVENEILGDTSKSKSQLLHGTAKPPIRLIRDTSATSRSSLNSSELAPLPIVGSPQWYREQAEDARRELEVRRSMQICNC